MVVHADKTERRLNVRAEADYVAVQNRLGTRIHQLVVCDADGNLHWGESIDPQATMQLQTVSASIAQIRLNTMFVANAPREPEEMSAEGERVFEIRRYYHYRSKSADSWGHIRLATSRLEWALAEHGARSPYRPQPRSYLAIVERSLDVPVGVPDAQHEGSFHVVRGRW